MISHFLLNMSRNYLTVFIVAFFSSTPLWAADLNPKIVISQPLQYLGSVDEGLEATGVIVVRNVGEADLDIVGIKVGAGGSVDDFEPTLIEPDREHRFRFKVNTKGRVGEVITQFRVLSTDPKNPTFMVNVVTRVITEYHRNASISEIFKGECSGCHAKPASGQVDEPLFESVCYMCHGHHGMGGGVRPINDMDYLTGKNPDYFKKIISDGIPGVMPGFSSRNDGPLSDYQIDSLAELMEWWKQGYMFRKNPSILAR